MARILLVDDDDATRRVLTALLRHEGHEVLLAANGKQALLLVGQQAPDIVLSDIRMPGMDGIEFCREMRKDESLAATYVILATGFNTPEAKTLGIASGADDYIGKPILADELNARIRMAGRIRALQIEATEARRRTGEAEKGRMEYERLGVRFKNLRGDLTTNLGTLLDAARRASEAARQGDLKRAYAIAEELCGDIENLRAKIAPREGS